MRTHLPTSSFELRTALPRTASPSGTVDRGQSLRMSASLCPMPLPSWVINGTTVLPAKSQEVRNVATGGAMVAHQQG